jgi:hypothetical protein
MGRGAETDKGGFSQDPERVNKFNSPGYSEQSEHNLGIKSEIICDPVRVT